MIGPRQPELPDEKLLEKLEENALKIGELGVPEPVEYGWSGARHVLDGAFSFQNNVYNDCLYFALRIDTNKVPGELKKAYQLMEEEAIAKDNPSGFISKKQKKDVKTTITRKVEDELRSGKFRRSKIIPMLWDLPSGMVYCQAGRAIRRSCWRSSIAPSIWTCSRFHRARLRCDCSNRKANAGIMRT